jgi:hypothetical protein
VPHRLCIGYCFQRRFVISEILNSTFKVVLIIGDSGSGGIDEGSRNLNERQTVAGPTPVSWVSHRL